MDSVFNPSYFVCLYKFTTIANSCMSHKPGFNTKCYNACIMTQRSSNYINLDLYYFIAVTHVKIEIIK